MKQSLFYALFSALVTALLLGASPAQAQPAPADATTYVSVVHTGDLALGTQEGKRQLRLRLARAARDVCGAASDADLKGKNQVRECRGEVMERASSQSERLIAEARHGATIAVTATR